MNANRRIKVQEAIEILRTVQEEEQDALDNLPESFQSGEQGDKLQENIDVIENCCSELDDIISN